jgi:hypothetical protein
VYVVVWGATLYGETGHARRRSCGEDVGIQSWGNRRDNVPDGSVVAKGTVLNVDR